MSSTFEITPPAPLTKSAVSSVSQNGMRLPRIVSPLLVNSGADHACESWPECSASVGDMVVAFIPSGLNIRSRANSWKVRFEYTDSRRAAVTYIYSTVSSATIEELAWAENEQHCCKMIVDEVRESYQDVLDEGLNLARYPQDHKHSPV